jgi:hypothetical protein
MTQIKDTEVESFIEALASQSATPGGGSAAAIIGSTSFLAPPISTSPRRGTPPSTMIASMTAGTVAEAPGAFQGDGACAGRGSRGARPQTGSTSTTRGRWARSA